MENADQQVLTQLAAWLANGQRAWLCTVVKTWGSSPRPVGSLLCCNDEGHLVGSLSGGCIEEDLLETLKRGEMASTGPEVLVYGVTQAETERLGLPCGGQLHVVVEPMGPAQRDAIDQVVSRVSSRACVERRVDIADGTMTISDQERYRNLEFIGEFANTRTPGERFLVQTYGPRYQLFLIGAGQVSQYLAEMAKALDYHVIVCDPREHLLEQFNVEGAQLVSDMPDDAVRQHAQDNFSAIIALTHDPRIDDMGLMEALNTDAFFIGAMGSTRTSAKRRERLLMLDLDESQIARLHAPVGLPIGSKTPAEIAIAILAQLTALRSEKVETIQADYRAVSA